MKNTILIAEDDKDIIDLLKLYLESDEIMIVAACDGLDALKKFSEHDIDIALVDIMMPNMDGYTLIKEIRKTSNIPIIVISAKTMEGDKILGLNIGADDYIEKPFKGLEVAARVNSQLRRYNKLGASSRLQADPVLKAGELVLDTSEITLKKNGKSIYITPAEFKILRLLMQSPNTVFTKSQIYNKVFGEYFESDENTLMVHISNLRSKIEDDSRNPKYIKTIRGLGYKIEKR
jgi:DNA-binding response OmpR family regulator